MKKVLPKLFVFIVLIIMFDQVYGLFAKYLVEHPKGGSVYLDKFICDSTKADMLIFGSSKAQNQYDPQILEDTLSMSVFNCGRHGMGMIYNYGRWKIISKRYVPKVVVYEFLPIVDLMVRDDNTIFINPLRPYYGNVPGIDSIFWIIDTTERYKMLSKSYKYHSLLDYFESYRSKEWLQTGYGKPNDQVLDPSKVKIESFSYQLDSVKLYFAEKFVSEVSRKTKLIIAISPMYGFHDDHGGLKEIKQICAKYGVPFIDHFCDSAFVDNAMLYKDMAHFNRKGSVKWSRLIASELKSYIDNSNN